MAMLVSRRVIHPRLWNWMMWQSVFLYLLLAFFFVANVPSLPRQAWRTQNIRWSIKNIKAHPTASLLKGEHQFQQTIKKQARHIFFFFFSDLVCCQLINFHKSQTHVFSPTRFFFWSSLSTIHHWWHHVGFKCPNTLKAQHCCQWWLGNLSSE